MVALKFLDTALPLMVLIIAACRIHCGNWGSMSVRAAGYVIYRRLSDKIEFLLLQASYGDYHWSPPKGSGHLS